MQKLSEHKCSRTTPFRQLVNLHVCHLANRKPISQNLKTIKLFEFCILNFELS